MMTAEQVTHAGEVARTKRVGSPLRVLYSGMLQTRKRVDALVEAVRLLVDEGADLELAIVGDGPQREELQGLSDDLTTRGIVRFVGALPFDESLRWYEWAHCLVLPSQHSEGWPKVIAEGMSHGLMCVAVAHGQVPTMLQGRGVLVETGAPPEIAAALREVMRAPERCRAISSAASNWARQYSLETLRAALSRLLRTRWALHENADGANDRDPVRLGQRTKW